MTDNFLFNVDLSNYYNKNNIDTTLAKSQDIANIIIGVFGQINLKQDIITSGASSIVTDNLIGSRLLISDTIGKVATSNVTSTELGHLSGINSNSQTQLNNKLSSTSRRDLEWI